MDIKTRRGIVRWLLILSLLVCGLAQGFAQNKAAQPGKPAAPLPAAAQSNIKWFKDPNSIMPMRKMTNAERRAAARRNHDRLAKAEAQRKQSPANQGVQQ